MTTNMWQRALLALGVTILVLLVVEIVLSVAATTHGNTPARITQVTAGPYPLKVSLYKDPADAGFALPFAIAPQKMARGLLIYEVSSIPGKEVDATEVRASIAADTHVMNGVQGGAEITVQGPWSLHIIITGPAGRGEAMVPIRAIGPAALPLWAGWLIGCTPLYGLLIFLLAQRGQKKNAKSDPISAINREKRKSGIPV